MGVDEQYEDRLEGQRYDYKHKLRHSIAKLLFKQCTCDKCTNGPFKESPFYILPSREDMECPDFPNDLNECFRWLVPKFRLDFGEETFMEMLKEWVDEFVLHSPPTEPALHLCIAVQTYYENLRNK